MKKYQQPALTVVALNEPLMTLSGSTGDKMDDLNDGASGIGISEGTESGTFRSSYHGRSLWEDEDDL